ncbi:cobyrinate a,c-diamide synthase [Desulfovibrio ferrophilus]|uniref:cobyrinate a,c-diamide synthase n=1 Tax=Desulfovibrio ferrophilus TaxID=241368 RepID=UPI000F8316D2|nr:cobyrinate a,c-diamide synthase [Desulfovibrio ferrophilus]
MSIPRLVVTGLSGGAGKTINSLGLARAWSEAGKTVSPFKKGPDYIDAVWLGLAARRPSSNLDPYFMQPETIRSLFAHRAHLADVAVIEGNRGLYDGMDVDGSCSTAELARILDAPVLLSMDCTKMTRTAAAVLSGIAGFEDGVNLGGVILNRTASERHRSILTSSIEQYTDVPVLGALPKISPDPIPERHMGLISNREYDGQEEILSNLARLMRDNCDLERIWELACSAGPLTGVAPLWPEASKPAEVTIGYVRDAALWFYYEENLEALSRAGAKLVELSLLDDSPWPEIHGLYLGGGFPETLAEDLASRCEMGQRVRSLSEAGLPIYAECGGFMFLTESVTWGDKTWPMAGVIPVRTDLCKRPHGLGYVRAEVLQDNPYHPKGSVLVGHEFHYSQCLSDATADALPMALRMERGTGMIGGFDGYMVRNTFACYTHIHALGTPWWAENFVKTAEAWKEG